MTDCPDSLSRTVVLGADAPTFALLQNLCAANAPAVAHPLEGPTGRSTHVLISLVVVAVQDGAADLDMLLAQAADYQAPIIVLGWQIPSEARARAFAWGVRDVITMPRSSRELALRLQMRRS